MSVTAENFFDPVIDETPAGQVRRDQWDRPLIICPPGMNDDWRRKVDDLVPYHRASSFGHLLEDTINLDAWGKRQVLRGAALGGPRMAQEILRIGDPDEVRDTPQFKGRKAALDAIVDQAEELAGSHKRSALGTAIHEATERVDRGEMLTGLHPFLINRAEAYWRFCREHDITITSVETFGVEDVHRVAGTWDRTGWWRRKHKILDVKTNRSMEWAGITYAVQVAEYAHMSAYDPATGARTPHEVMDLEQGVIIHVSGDLDGPVNLHPVDIGVGWRWAKLVDMVKAAQREGKKSITLLDEDPLLRAIRSATTVEALYALYTPEWTAAHRVAADDALRELTSE